MRLNHLAVVMPAYNEAVGIPGFVRELHASLAPLAERLDIVVVDDRSTDATAEVLTELASELPGLHVITAEQNRGHGPTALAAYRAGLELEPDLLVHVDGDGQFHGADLARLVNAALDTDADVVHGVRTGRTDPWFRRVLTRLGRHARHGRGRAAHPRREHAVARLPSGHAAHAHGGGA